MVKFMRQVKEPLGKTPRHLAIIMDGIERWAQEKGMPPVEGYRAGNLWPVIEGCMEHGVEVLTLHALTRQPGDMDGLATLLEEVIGGEGQKLRQNGIQLRYIGRLEGLPEGLVRKIREATERTKDNERLILNITLNYRGRTEIVDAVRRMIEDGVDPDSLDDELFSRYLYTAGLPDPDLIVRTAGEMRFSDFLIWQGAYAEYYFTPTCWPDFNEEELYRALLSYSKRERRFGRLGES